MILRITKIGEEKHATEIFVPIKCDQLFVKDEYNGINFTYLLIRRCNLHLHLSLCDLAPFSEPLLHVLYQITVKLVI